MARLRRQPPPRLSLFHKKLAVDRSYSVSKLLQKSMLTLQSSCTTTIKSARHRADTHAIKLTRSIDQASYRKPCPHSMWCNRALGKTYDGERDGGGRGRAGARPCVCSTRAKDPPPPLKPPPQRCVAHLKKTPTTAWLCHVSSCEYQSSTEPRTHSDPTLPCSRAAHVRGAQQRQSRDVLRRPSKPQLSIF